MTTSLAPNSQTKIYAPRDGEDVNSGPFRAQPILNAISLDVCALEVLYRNAKPFNNEAEMLKVDMEALEYASQLRGQSRLRVHCNMELSSLIRVSQQAIQKNIRPGVVIELVERNDLLKNPDAFIRIQDMVSCILACGGAIAMDDVTPSDIEIKAIKALRPNILKVTNRESLIAIRSLTGQNQIIAECIETISDAQVAKSLGAHELQGYWCDELATKADRKVVPSWEP